MSSSVLLAETTFAMSHQLETSIKTKNLMIFPRIPAFWGCGGEGKQQHISSSNFFTLLFLPHSCNVCVQCGSRVWQQDVCILSPSTHAFDPCVAIFRISEQADATSVRIFSGVVSLDLF